MNITIKYSLIVPITDVLRNVSQIEHERRRIVNYYCVRQPHIANAKGNRISSARI